MDLSLGPSVFCMVWGNPGVTGAQMTLKTDPRFLEEKKSLNPLKALKP
jgi:hypothetical protein